MSDEIRNRALLDRVNADEAWFRAGKVAPIWAMRAVEDQTVETLEGVEQVEAGDFICRGEGGDIWPQTARSLDAKYIPEGQPDSDGWQEYVPRPDAPGVLAAEINHPFTVHASWGELSGKPGDFLVKSYSDKDIAYPEDVWIVDRSVFLASYEVPESS